MLNVLLYLTYVHLYQNKKILNALKDIIILTFSINYLKTGVGETGYDHIMSFRRQIFFKHDDIVKLLGSLLISYEETNFRIFLQMTE